MSSRWRSWTGRTLPEVCFQGMCIRAHHQSKTGSVERRWMLKADEPELTLPTSTAAVAMASPGLDVEVAG